MIETQELGRRLGQMLITFNFEPSATLLVEADEHRLIDSQELVDASAFTKT